MTRTIIMLLALVMVLSAGSALWAAPSYNGYTGLLFVPTAATLNTGELNIAAQSIDFDLGSFSGGSLTYGMTDKWEAGISFVDQSAGLLDGFSLNTKFRISDFGEASIISAGAIFPLDGDTGGTDEVSVYGVLSQQLVIPGIDANPITGHIGWGTGGTLDGLFLGLEGVINPRTTVLAEYDSNDINAGVRFALSERFRASVALFDLTDLGFQVSYNQRF